MRYSPADVQVLVWAYKFIRELARRMPWYRGELLSMAHDLGERYEGSFGPYLGNLIVDIATRRLLRAFITPTGLPYARVSCISVLTTYDLCAYERKINLRHGVLMGETFETCQ